MSRGQLTIRIEESLLAKLKIIADNEKRSINNQYEYYLEKCVKEYELQNGAVTVSDKL